MPGLNWKPNAQEVLDRRRRFFRRQMLDRNGGRMSFRSSSIRPS